MDLYLLDILLYSKEEENIRSESIYSKRPPPYMKKSINSLGMEAMAPHLLAKDKFVLVDL